MDDDCCSSYYCSVVRSCDIDPLIYAELCSTAKEENPQPAVEQFLILHSSLTSAGLISESLKTTSAVCSCSSADQSTTISEETARVFSDSHRRAGAWVHAALSTDLSALSVYAHKSQPMLSGTVPSQVVVVLGSSSSKTTAPSLKGTSFSQPKSRAPATYINVGKQRPAAATEVAVLQPARQWEKGGGVKEGVELAQALGEEAKHWFVGFVERFLDTEASGDMRLPWDRDVVAGMLSQLKKVNDWLDEAGRPDETGEEEGFSAAAAGGLPQETVDRLRKKIYEYLLTHVESAAVALGGGGCAGNPPTAAVVGRPLVRKS